MSPRRRRQGTQWLAPSPPASADISRAFAVEVDYPALAGNNAGYEI